VRINTDGTVDKYLEPTYTQIDSSTDWIIPNGAASALYEVRITNIVDIGGDTLTWETGSAARDTWLAISSNLQWKVLAAGPGGADSHGAQFDMEVRFNGGAVLATGAYEILSELE